MDSFMDLAVETKAFLQAWILQLSPTMSLTYITPLRNTCY